MVKFLTGSGEFFKQRKDVDYVGFRSQVPFFAYERDERDHVDHFWYRDGITKADLFAWHRPRGGNKWSLNFAPLITKEFLDHLGIDIFQEDRDDVYWVVRKVFSIEYRWPNDRRYGKYLYRIYIYTCFMRNQALELTDEQRTNAFNIYRRKYPDPSVIRGIYEFFEVPEDEIEYGMAQVFDPEDEDD